RRAESRGRESQDPGPRPHVEDPRAVEVLLLQGEQRQPRGRMPAGSERAGGRDPQGDPTLRSEGIRRVARIDPEPSSDREGPRCRAERLQRVLFRDLRDELEPDSAARQSRAGPPRGVRVAKAGDQVASLLGEAKGTEERERSEHGVVLGAPRDDEAGVPRPSQITKRSSSPSRRLRAGTRAPRRAWRTPAAAPSRPPSETSGPRLPRGPRARRAPPGPA